jgi:hypothetical protein
MDRRPFFLATLLVASLAVPAVATAADDPVRPAGDPRGVPEARVERIVIDDDNARIDELRVRGQTQRIVVRPKRTTMRSYEVITGDGSRDLSPGPGSTRGAAGQRVWNVLVF